MCSALNPSEDEVLAVAMTSRLDQWMAVLRQREVAGDPVTDLRLINDLARMFSLPPTGPWDPDDIGALLTVAAALVRRVLDAERIELDEP